MFENVFTGFKVLLYHLIVSQLKIIIIIIITLPYYTCL